MGDFDVLVVRWKEGEEEEVVSGDFDVLVVRLKEGAEEEVLSGRL